MPLTEVGLWGPEVDSRELGPSFGHAETRSRAQPFLERLPDQLPFLSWYMLFVRLRLAL
jgi:hypothetical protein